jgi:hypothetical protein
MVRLGELMMILELPRQGVSVTAITRRTGRVAPVQTRFIVMQIAAVAWLRCMLS